jgi:hypothetical protein
MSCGIAEKDDLYGYAIFNHTNHYLCCEEGSRRAEAFGAYLDEADVLGVAAEALPAAHEPVLPDEAVGVGAHTAAITNQHHGIH